jgi:DNA ligase-1
MKFCSAPTPKRSEIPSSESNPNKSSQPVPAVDAAKVPIKNSASFTKSQSSQPSFESHSYSLNPDPRSLSSERFDIILDARFKVQEPVPFKCLTGAFEEVESSKGKNSKNIQKEIMSNLFRSIIVLNPAHLVKCFYLCIGRLCPEHHGTELGIGNEMLYKAIAKTVGQTPKSIKASENNIGDLGTVAGNGKASQKNLTSYFSKQTKKVPLTIERVYDSLWKIATTHGNNSVALKEDELIKLMQQADSEEIKYLVRIVQKSLKIGASELTMISALARAASLTPPNQSFPPQVVKAEVSSLSEAFEECLSKAINECPDYDKVIGELLKYSPGDDITSIFKECRITPGTPVKPMLAQPTKGIKEILKRFTDIEFTCEFKYDGMRAQIHILPDRTIKIYSRGAEDMTGMYPDIIQFLQQHINPDSISDCIIDSEVVAFDSRTNRIKPFQEIQHRSRVNVDIHSIEINVCVFVFDILYLNGRSLLDLNLNDRREVLFKSIQEEKGKLQYIEFKNVTLFEDIESLLVESVRIGCEGLMVKTLVSNAQYEPARRSFNWLKLKKDYITEDSGQNKMTDSVDLIPIGAYFGTGKRTGVYGSYLLAIYDPDNDEYQTVCKAGTGFKEEMLQLMFSTLKDLEIPKPLSNFRSLHNDIDVWFQPEIVWEIQGADLSISPKHTSAWGRAAENKGISIRFPRFVRNRPDKKPHDSTSPEQILKMFYDQSCIQDF